MTGRIRCRPMSMSASNGFWPKYTQYSLEPNGGEIRVVVMPPAGRMFRPGPLKMKISMMPSQKVGIA